MSEFLSRVLLPVADPDDAEATTAALLEHLADDVGTVVAINVIEKGGGAIDKAPLEKMQELAEESFERVVTRCEAAGVPVETEVHYGTDVIETIVEAAAEEGVSAIAFTPRETGRLVRLLSGNETYALVTDTQIPVVVLPETTSGTTTG